MKKIPYLIAFLTLIISCGGNGDQSTSTVSAVTQAATAVATQAVAAAATQAATAAATQAATAVATQAATAAATQAATAAATQAATPVATQATVQPASSSSMQGMDPSKMQGSAGMMQGSMGMMGTNDPPELENLLILNFGPYNAATRTSGDFEFFSGFPHPFFDEFGRVHSAGTPTEYDNPTFEYKVPRSTKVYFPISGVIDMITWQPTTSYKQDDWELNIKPWRGSDWAVVIDHVVAITCDRSDSAVCADQLTVNGIPLASGSQVNAGDLLGYVGNYEGAYGSDPFGRTEITIGEYVTEGNKRNFMNYCPTNYLKSDVKVKVRAAVNEVMASYELWSGDSSFYDEASMIAPGCRYTKIYEVDGKTTPTR